MAADGILLVTLFLMSTGRVPIYVTAVAGSVCACLAAGIPLSGEAPETVRHLLGQALRPMPVSDMLGALLFIGIMKQSHYMDVILHVLMELGQKAGGAPGVALAAGFAAAVLGSLSAFTQPFLAASSAGPAAVRLGMSPSRAAGMISLSNALANACSFTHPTFLAVLAVTGVSFGAINLWGFAGAVWILLFAYWRARWEMKGSAAPEGGIEPLPSGSPSAKAAFFPFAMFCAAVFFGVPMFVAGLAAGLLVCFQCRMSLAKGESSMMSGISIPVMAAMSLLFMAEVLDRSGLVNAVIRHASPLLAAAPVQILFLISAAAGLVTQSNAAAAAVVIPAAQAAMAMGCEPLAVSFAAITGCAVMQLFLTGGAVTSLALVVKVVPGASLREANDWQRPIILADGAVCFLLTFLV